MLIFQSQLQRVQLSKKLLLQSAGRMSFAKVCRLPDLIQMSNECQQAGKAYRTQAITRRI